MPEVLFEIRHHASRPYTPNYPPQQLPESEKRSLLSFLPAPGISQIKEKWNEYRNPRKKWKPISLFISPRGEHLAVACGSQITFFQKNDDYREPCGNFTCSSLGTIRHGAWSDLHDIFGASDDTDTLYFVKANGEEITRITKRHLKVSLPIIGLIVQDISAISTSCLCSFNILASNGFLHCIEVSQDPGASITFKRPVNGASLKAFPRNVFCLDYHPELSLFAIVGDGGNVSSSSYPNTGPCCLSLWRRNRNLDLHLVFSTQYQGLYSSPKGYVGNLVSGKVQISPKGNFIATVDMTGCLDIFKLDKELSSVSHITRRGRYDSQLTNDLSNGEKNPLNEIVDFTWWSDYVLTIARRSGIVSMIDICSHVKLLGNNPVYSMPILERIPQTQGCIFLLENTSFEESSITSLNQFEFSKTQWNLISFSERSVSDMYNVLISNKSYDSALNFADRHGLDRDEVFKSKWLTSSHGTNETKLFLSSIKDKGFVLSECVDKVGPTEYDVKDLLSYGLRLTDRYRFSEFEDDYSSQAWDFRMKRLQLLQYRDRLETFLGINMGRFSVQEYRKFRDTPISKAAIALAESGKIGALNLLFKRHLYSVTPSILEILSAIPETVPVQTYAQLLPGRSPPINIALRETDWVESEKMVNFINKLSEKHEISSKIRTEPVVKQTSEFIWPTINELSLWYMNRARDIDSFSGQLDNSLCLIDLACQKGISELLRYYNDINYLHRLIFSDATDDAMDFTMSLASWERLDDYEKFKIMLKGVKEEGVVERLRDIAIPFMHSRSAYTDCEKAESFLVRWMKEMALQNNVDTCLRVIEEGCKDIRSNIFRNEVEAVDCALDCIYLFSVTDRWSTLATILAELQSIQDAHTCAGGFEKRLKLAEWHVEAGKLLAFYQVPKPISYFLEAHTDEKGVKQILRLILSKFIRRHPARSDAEWANMWLDMQLLQEKAFPFLDLEYILMEFCRGLLKAGRFSLARNYLKGTGSVCLAAEKAENIVIQAAREYFFSASSLACPEIWKAKECLNLYPNSTIVKSEADIIDVLTVKLPNLGVNLLPVQFRQIRDPMEIIKMAITSQPGAYLHIDELIEIAKLLGLKSQGEISTVEEAIAREAAVTGDLQLAFNLCLVLAKKGHGLVWDLCAAIARGPTINDMDVRSRKQLLGFALSHCDEASIGELLNAWKDLDMQGQCETLMTLTESSPHNFSSQSSSFICLPDHRSQDIVNLKVKDDQLTSHFENIKRVLSDIARDDGTNWECLLRENEKILSFASFQLLWLLELSRKEEYGKKLRTQAVVGLLSWLIRHDFALKDNLIASLAKLTMEPPLTEEDDTMGCSFLLNLIDAFNGVEIIEEQLRTRKNYKEVCSIMNIGMIYSSLHNSGLECEEPAQRKQLLLRKFQERHMPRRSGVPDEIDKVQSTFWREWKQKLDEQKSIADKTRLLEQLIPGVETTRFLSGDSKYIKSAVISLIESVKLEKKRILKDLLKLADTYGLNRTEVLVRYLGSVLESEIWTNDDITAEISEFKSEMLGCASLAIKAISLIVYPAINGCNKRRLAYIYSLLFELCLQLERNKEPLPNIPLERDHKPTLDFARFCKVVGEECEKISSIENLDFKNIAGLGGLNLQCFKSEVYKHVSELTLEPLANMVQTLVRTYDHPLSDDLMLSQDVYKYHALSLLTQLEARAKTEDIYDGNPENFQEFLTELEHIYDSSRRCFRVMSRSDAVDIMKQYFTLLIPSHGSYESLPGDSLWRDCLIQLINFWIKVIDDVLEFGSQEKSDADSLKICLKNLVMLVIEERVSPSQGWKIIFDYVNYGLMSNSAVEIFIFCRAIVFSGCGFGTVSEVFSEAISQFRRSSMLSSDVDGTLESIQDLPRLYLNILEPILQEFGAESHVQTNLYQLLSSLSKLEGNLEELKKVRHIIWERMAKFSHNLQIPSHLRVHALEVMESIRGGNFRGRSSELQSSVLPWEGWDEMIDDRDYMFNQEVTHQSDSSTRFTRTLVALRSSQLASAISPGMQITNEDLSTVELAVSCFLKMCGAATTDAHFEALLAILGEWEGYFILERNEEASDEKSETGNNWGNDDWEEGWESFQEEEKKWSSVHPLHVCWREIFKKLISKSRFRDVLKLIDRSLETNVILVDEDGTHCLTQILLGIDCFVSLVVALLLPYEAIQSQCLDAFDDELKRVGFSDIYGEELLILVLSSGVISNIIKKPSYGTTYSYICNLVGKFSRQCQEALLSSEQINDKKGFLFLFRKILFPCFLSELVRADQQILAGLMVTKFMHTNASLSLINVAEAGLIRYLEKQLQCLQGDKLFHENVDSTQTLRNTIISLRGKLENLIQSTLSVLSAKVG